MGTLDYTGITEIVAAVTGERQLDDSVGVAEVVKLDRRQFLKLTGVVGGGLMLALTAPRVFAQNGTFQPNGYIRIDQSGILLYAKNPEIGQGVKTSLPMIVAEELDAAWNDVEVVQSPINQSVYGAQFAGGSMSIPMNYHPLRQAGATARTMMVQAAAKRWGVDSASLTTQDSHVIQTATGNKLSYMDLAGEAAQLDVPNENDVTLKDPKDFRLLGNRITGVDNESLVRGEALFGTDTILPGMKYAVYHKCPAIGGTVKSANIEEIKKMPGVVDAFALDGKGSAMELLPGVAIVADSTWEAINAKRALRVEWDETDASKDSWTDASNEAERLRHEDGRRVANFGDFDAAFASSKSQVSSFYQYHFVSHAPMEPQNCTASFKDGALELWAPTQTPGSAIGMAARVCGIQPNRVALHQLRCGGGFGRRLYNDFVCEASAIAQHVDGPVKLQWTREDDLAYDLFRAGGFHQMDGSVDSQGKISGWRNRFITFEVGGTPVSSMNRGVYPGGLLQNVRAEQVGLQWSHRCAAWRAPNANVFAFVVGSFVHELAHAAGRDHLEVLLETFGEPRPMGGGMHTGRAANVIRLAAQKAGWGRDLPQGRGLGVAFYYSHQGHIAEVAEVSVGEVEGTTKNRRGDSVDRRKVTVHKVTVASDVGPIINLSGAENQVEGSVVDALSTMMDLSVTFENGRIQQNNFDSYKMLRMPSTPEVATHFVEPGENRPTGLGEPVFPPLAPAVCNAIFAACGRRVKTMPISEEGFYIA